jgi:hypothetical protein
VRAGELDLTLDHVTFVDDTLEGAGTTTVAGSILDAGPSGTVCVGPVVSQGGNLEHGTSCGLAMAGDVITIGSTELLFERRLAE